MRYLGFRSNEIGFSEPRKPLHALRKYLSRDEFFGALFIIGCANAVLPFVLGVTRSYGLIDAALATFHVSVIIWVAFVVGFYFMLREQRGSISRFDLAVGTGCLLLFALPIASASWLGLTALALYRLITSESGSCGSRGAIIILAVTLPTFWTKHLFSVVGKWILEADAILVSTMLGTSRNGNVFEFVNGSGYAQIYPPCSSVANMSLALVAWTIASQLAGRRWSIAGAGWYGLACLSVIAVNVTRLSLIGTYPDHFELIHGPVGSEIAAWITLVLIVGTCAFGVRRELLSRT
jgi:hypothetical protein